MTGGAADISIDSILARNARWRAGKTALVFNGRKITYRALAARTQRLANSLRGLGVRAGDRIAVLSTNNAVYVEIVFALSLLRAVWVPLNFRLAPGELAYIVNDSASNAVFFSADMQSIAEAVSEQTPAVGMWIGIGGKSALGDGYDEILAQSGETFSAEPVDGASLFSIMYTSGTTGKPKGVMLSHGAFLRGTEHLALAVHAAADEINLQVIPQFHAGGQIYQLAHLLVGATVVIAPRFEPGLVLDLIEQEGVTSMGFVPTMLVTLIEERRARQTDFSRVRRVMYGGSPIPEDRLALALNLMQAGFYQTYGQTETGVIVSVLDAADHRAGLNERPQLLQSCGRPIPGYDLRLVGDDGAEVERGDRGELVVSGDSLMDGYLNLPEATAKTLHGRWLHTGDMAWEDEEGYVYIVDRRTDMIISGGENIYPIEIEQVISAHPHVLDVAVIGVPDDRWGEAVKAVVALRPNATCSGDAIVEFCRGKLARFKLPASVDIVASIPRNASGKILKKELREAYWAGQSRRV